MARFKHGCRSNEEIFEGEGLAEYKRLEKIWQAEFPELSPAMSRVLERLVVADFQLQWTEQRLLQSEATLEELEVDEWTDDHHKKLQLFRRYHTTADRRFQRVLNTMKQFRKERENVPVAKAAVEAPVAAVAKQEPAMAKAISMRQTVVVSIEDGKTVTFTHPTTEMLLRRVVLADEKTLVFRVFEFPNGVPAEYAWAAEHYEERPPDAPVCQVQQEMKLAHWLKVVQREKASGSGHLGQCDDAD